MNLKRHGGCPKLCAGALSSGSTDKFEPQNPFRA